MAFVLAIDSKNSLEVETTGSVASVTAVIGIDPDKNVSYSVTVSFDSGTPMYGAELNFWIDEAPADSDLPSETFWNGRRTNFIEGEDRGAVLGMVLDAIQLLISQTSEKCVSMATMDPDMPAKALHKYLTITHLFEENGFSIRERDYHGYLSWLMERA